MFYTSLLCVALCAAQYAPVLTPWADNGVRVQIMAPGNPVSDPPISALLPSPPAFSTLVSSVSPLQLTNGNLAVSVDAATGYITATRVSDGAVLLRQTALVFDAPSVPNTRPGSHSALVTFAGHAGEKVYGFGEHRTGAVNQMPFQKRFADSEDYGKSRGGDVSIPYYSSSLGYGFLWNSPSYGFVDVSEAAISWYSNASMGVDVWLSTLPADFVPGGAVSPFRSLLAQYVDAVGHAPQMPFYATGFIQCKDRYRNQSQLLAVAQGYLDRGLPISVIVIDWMHWVHQGDWAFNPVCWPDPQGMVDQLSTQGIETMVTYWPFQTTGSQHWTEFNSSGYLVEPYAGGQKAYDGDQFLVDETNPAARAAAFAGFWDGYGKYGIKTVWIDAAEPEHNGASMEGLWKLQGGTDGELMMGWNQLHTRMLAEGFSAKGITAEDYFILPRSAWVGSWRYSAALWSGDIQSTFEELAIQIKVVQGTLMSGVALWTTDIGGYWGGDPSNPQFQELITRWFQVWNLAGGEDTPNYRGIVRVMRLRENLRQYVKNINAETAATGWPMVRAMVLAFPQDPGCAGADVEDQFMFGDDWLVAPVYTYKATSRSVYIPPAPVNQTWFYFFNDSDIGAGGARVDVPTTNLEEFPLFYLRPVVPLQPTTFNVTNFFSAQRGDTVACLADTCYSDNGPKQDGAYAPFVVEGVGQLSDGPVVVNGKAYSFPLQPLNLFFSPKHQDNFVSTNATPPDATYTQQGGGVAFNNGYAFAAPAPPGALPLQIWLKRGAGDAQDYATVASPAGIAWVQARGYSFVGNDGAFILPSGWTPPPS